MRPLNRSITFVCAIFFTLLSVVLSAATYRIYTQSMYQRYQRQMESVVNYMEGHIDHDDMSQCAKTCVESETYRETQAFFDTFFDHYGDIHYLYLMDAQMEGDTCRLIDLCDANSSWEKANDPENVIRLGDEETDRYPEETVREFARIQQGDEDVFFLNASQWGVDYTLARPMVNSAGEHYGILCADVSVNELRHTIYRNIYINIAVIVILGVFFIVMLLLWMRANVTTPLKQLEKSMSEFVSRSTGRRNPEDLLFIPPQLHTRNEVQSLSEAVTKLSVDMREYVKGILAAEDETRGLQAHMSEMSTIAYKDPLTCVKNKAAYDKKVQALSWDILNRISRFGIVMVDLNYLKVINDRYGHEHGDDYIKGSCNLICNVFDHSPVYRVGGDEFLVVIQGRDYDDREELYQELRRQFARSTQDEEADPWHRYSAAVGMAVYQPGDDVEAVFNRADQEMYQVKTAMKVER